MNRMLNFYFSAIVCCLMSFNVSAKDVYRLVGMAPVDDANSSVAHNLPLPVDLSSSSTLTYEKGYFSLYIYGSPYYTNFTCNIKAESKYSATERPLDFYLLDIFETREKLTKFLERKFHINSDNWMDFYILGESTVPACAALRNTTIHASKNELTMVQLPYIYLFVKQTHPFANAADGFDCSKANTNVEHLICSNPDLVKMDSDVARGFVDMQIVYSKEISYQDPVRVDQINWISTVRNKCTTVSCLSSAYKARIQYIKGKISDEFPSYPAEEPEPESD